MAERTGPQLYSIAAHRGFADALVAGLVPRYAEKDVGLARLTLLLASQRAARTVTEAFVRHSGASGPGGLLLPRMVVVGDLDLDETLGPLLDPLGAGAVIAPAVDPVRRWLRLAELLGQELGDKAPKGPALLRQAFELGRTMDRLLVEGIAPEQLISDEVIGIIGEQARHWVESTKTFLLVHNEWRKQLEASGEQDAPARRNALFDHAARRWQETPPAHAVVAAGISSASPALARLLRVVSELPRGAVILQDLDLSLGDAVWKALGTAGSPVEPGDPPFGRHDAVTHPQYHLKLLLGRMGINRGEVQPWHRAGPGAAPPERSRAISNLFLPSEASARWVKLEAGERRLSGVRLMESAHPGEEAQAIAILIREALEQPEKRVALITPDRALAARVIGHLERWGIKGDDTAGQPLPQTTAGRLFLLLAEVVAAQATPVPLLALLAHPYAGESFGRADWLDHVRQLDLALRGPRPGAGLEPLRAMINAMEKHAKGITAWWEQVEQVLAPLLDFGEEAPLAEMLDQLAGAAERLSEGRVWGEADGRGLTAFIEELREAARSVGSRLEPEGLATVLRDAMDRQAVRPPWGGHPRIAIYGLIEARMSRADLVICGGLAEGVWPAAPAPDALLAPAVMRALGVPGADFRIGLAAHDLAAALGAPEVVLSHARRDDAGPVIPSRFVLRVRAMLGEKLLAQHQDQGAVVLARALNNPLLVPAHPQPAPCPSPEQRDVPIAVTGLDRLRSDPYQFYASAILRLRALDLIDAEPTAAWKGTAVHEILRRWHDENGDLTTIAEAELARMSAHPLVRGLWWPRLIAGLQWVEQKLRELESEDRAVLVSEKAGHFTYKGVKIAGRADRIDRLADGSLAIVDYKTGTPPRAKMVQQGYALQLGLIGLMAREGAFAGVSGEPKAYEYWTLRRTKNDKNSFGEAITPLLTGKKRTGIKPEDFLPETERFLTEAINFWIKGDHPFTARLNPDVPGYADFDQLMRLDEWQGRGKAVK